MDIEYLKIIETFYLSSIKVSILEKYIFVLWKYLYIKVIYKRTLYIYHYLHSDSFSHNTIVIVRWKVNFYVHVFVQNKFLQSPTDTAIVDTSVFRS